MTHGPTPPRCSPVRLRFLVALNPPVPPSLADDDVVSFLPMEAIGEDGSLDLRRQRLAGEVRASYSYFADGDVVYAKVTPCFENGKGAVLWGLENGQGFGTTELTVLRPGKHLSAGFLHYLVISEPFRQGGAGAMTGAGGLKRVPEEFAANFAVALPSAEEQRQLVAALDRETARIDALIEKKTRFIALLREKRQALITQAVTQGLDSSVPMKDSGVAWLGRVPAHWAAIRIRYVARLESGHTPDRQTTEYWEHCTIPWVSLSDSEQLRRTDYIRETAKQINELGLANSSARLLPPETVVMTRDATVGLCAILGLTMAVSQHLVAWVPSAEVDSKYLLLVLRSMGRWLDQLTTGTTIRTIGMDNIKDLRMPLPPIEEQRLIARRVEEQWTRLASLMDRTARSVDLLRERRSALITAAVTGQIDLREAA